MPEPVKHSTNHLFVVSIVYGQRTTGLVHFSQMRIGSVCYVIVGDNLSGMQVVIIIIQKISIKMILEE